MTCDGKHGIDDVVHALHDIPRIDVSLGCARVYNAQCDLILVS